MTIKVFLVDDHRLFLSGVRSELGGTYEIVGEAGDVKQAVAGIHDVAPDVVLLDVHLPGGGGAAVIRGCADLETKFLALSVSDAHVKSPDTLWSVQLVAGHREKVDT
jgi:DNA-binding NarL/FixJ family response regulator